MEFILPLVCNFTWWVRQNCVFEVYRHLPDVVPHPRRTETSNFALAKAKKLVYLRVAFMLNAIEIISLYFYKKCRPDQTRPDQIRPDQTTGSQVCSEDPTVVHFCSICSEYLHYVTKQQLDINTEYLILSYIFIHQHFSVSSASVFRATYKNTNNTQ